MAKKKSKKSPAEPALIPAWLFALPTPKSTGKKKNGKSPAVVPPLPLAHIVQSPIFPLLVSPLPRFELTGIATGPGRAHEIASMSCPLPIAGGFPPALVPDAPSSPDTPQAWGLVQSPGSRCYSVVEQNGSRPDFPGSDPPPEAWSSTSVPGPVITPSCVSTLAAPAPASTLSLCTAPLSPTSPALRPDAPPTINAPEVPPEETQPKMTKTAIKKAKMKAKAAAAAATAANSSSELDGPSLSTHQTPASAEPSNSLCTSPPQCSAPPGNPAQPESDLRITAPLTPVYTDVHISS